MSAIPDHVETKIQSTWKPMQISLTFFSQVRSIGLKRAACKALLDILLRPELFFIEFAMGGNWGIKSAPHRITLHDFAALRVWFQKDPLYGFGLAYINGMLEVKSDVLSLIDSMNALRHTTKLSNFERLFFGFCLACLPKSILESETYAFQSEHKPHTIERDKEAVAYHYNLPLPFWQLLLSKSLLYTTGYYVEDSYAIDEASEAKFAMACRKIEIKNGESLLDVGCGWGGFLIYAAQKFPESQFFGVTIAEDQARYAQERIKALGLDNCQVTYLHIMEMDERKKFDKIVAFQSTEHMQDDELLLFFKKVHQLLRADGTLFIEFMNCKLNMKRATHKFMDSYIFPDGWQFPLVTGLESAEKAGFELFDLEGCHKDYERTIQSWNDNFDKHFTACADAIGNIYRTRAMRLYFYWALWVAKSKRLKVHYCLWKKIDQEYWQAKRDFATCEK